MMIREGSSRSTRVTANGRRMLPECGARLTKSSIDDYLHNVPRQPQCCACRWPLDNRSSLGSAPWAL
jgi:hypothetical protein